MSEEEATERFRCEAAFLIRDELATHLSDRHRMRLLNASLDRYLDALARLNPGTEYLGARDSEAVRAGVPMREAKRTG